MTVETQPRVALSVLLDAYRQMCRVAEMAQTYDDNRKIAKYVHSTSRGHEAIQLATGMLLKPQDFVYPYYRDESILLGIGCTPYELMLQLLAKADDPFSGGKMYYAHPSLRREGQPKVPYQSSATGMQAIPATGAAHGLRFQEQAGTATWKIGPEAPLVVCSLGDGSMTEGEVAEALQMAVLHKLPIVYLVQDNDWGISARGEEMRAMDAVEFSRGFKGLEAVRVDGTDFEACYEMMHEVFETVRIDRRPVLVHATCPLLGHHTSGVRREFYRTEDELAELSERDPRVRLVSHLVSLGMAPAEIESIENEAKTEVADAWERAKAAPEPGPERLFEHIFAPTPVTEELGERSPAGREPVVMVDAALHAIEEIFAQHPEALLYGQDVGIRLGGVFREAATLAQKFGTHRVFNTPIQEAYIIGSTSGMAAVGLRPIVEVQFADYIWPGLNQLFTEVSRSYYLSNGKWPVANIIRVPIGAYTGGGPFHSSSVESVLLNIRGIKVAYPSNAADMKGLMKAAFHDPNPVVMLEHKGLYWSKVPGTQAAKTVEPDADYVIPFGKARLEVAATDEAVRGGESCAVITYGMGVHWARNAVQQRFVGQVDVLDLRTLEPIDWPAIEALAQKHGKVLVVTEEPAPNSFAEALAGRIGRLCYKYLDGPVEVIGSACVPGIPMNEGLEVAYLQGIEGVGDAISKVMSW